MRYKLPSSSCNQMQNDYCCYFLQEAMKSSLCDTLYVTDVLAEFEADTFFPTIDTTVYQLVK